MSPVLKLSYQQTPVQQIEDNLFTAARLSLLVKREDLNHPLVSGNKWWKLKYNLQRAIEEKHDTLLTFGGAYSNHIYAVAAAARELNLKSIGIIRGEEILPLNDTLAFARSNGMQLHFISRETYRNKNDGSFLHQLTSSFGRFYLIPEGGSNALAVEGIDEFSSTLGDDFDYLCCPVGTGATLAGLIRGMKGRKKIIGFPVLKGGDSWKDEVLKYNPGYSNWTLINDFHAGGYAKVDPALREFMNVFSANQSVPLEPVYSAKMFHGIYKLASDGFFESGSRIMAIHTGGIRR